MSEVIHVDFSKKNVTEQQGVPGTHVDPSLNAYLDNLRDQGVDDDDIHDILDAIENVDHYMKCDEVIRQFADGWLQQFL